MPSSIRAPLAALPPLRRCVLCPTDLSDRSAVALRFAIAVARTHGFPITLLFIGPTSADPLPPRAGRTLRDELHVFCAPAFDAGVAVEIELRRGRPAEVILAFSREQGDGAIVLSPGPSFQQQVAAAVVRGASLPVLSIPPSADGPETLSSGPVRSVLCAIDLSDLSAGVLDLAARVAREANARLTVLSVLDSFSRKEPVGVRRIDMTEFRRRAERLCRAQVVAHVDCLEPAPPRVDVVTEFGDAAATILEVASARQADVVVIGAPPRGRARLAMFGSTTDRVLHETTCPVLTIRDLDGR